MLKREYSNYIFIVLIIVFIYLSWMIIEPFFIAILSACVLSYLFYPIFKYLKKKTKREIFSAFLVILLILLIILIPLTLLLNSLINEIDQTLDYVKSFSSTKDFISINCDNRENLFCNYYYTIKEKYPEFNLMNTMIESGKEIKNYVVNWLGIITSGIFQFFITIYITFFLLIDGKKLIKKTKELLSLKKIHEKKINNTITSTTKAVVFGNVITAFIQGFIAAIGYWLIGDVGNSILLGIATGFFALIPFFGTAVIWFPTCIYLLVFGISYSDGNMIIRSILLFLYSALVVSTIDNIIKPKIIGDKANIHPVIVLLGVLGGLKFLSVPGIILGPVILAVMVKLFELFLKERKKI
jgi:predicted PurR-regulated permease PerM